MTYAIENREQVEATANALYAKLEAGARHYFEGKPVTRYIVTAHRWQPENSIESAWAIVPRWIYPDRPDLPEFGGEAIPYREALQRLHGD